MNKKVKKKLGHIKYFPELEQGSDEWFSARLGLLTASGMKHILTSVNKKASKSTTHLYEILSQRISSYVEPFYVNDDMLRGGEDEIAAKALYSKNYSKVSDMGFITNDKWGFILGYSPDGMVGDDGLIECKSRKQKLQVETIVSGEVPEEYILQIQTGLLVSERKWCDFISYSGGLPMCTIRVYPDEETQDSILSASKDFHDNLDSLLNKYYSHINDTNKRFIPTERKKPEEEMHE